MPVKIPFARRAPALPSVKGEISLPQDVQQTLEAAGVNGNAVLKAQTDLDLQGRWGERYLVATPERVLVVTRHKVGAPIHASASGVRDDAGEISTPRDRAQLALTSGGDESSASRVTIDLDVPLSDISQAEAKALVGASSLEVRLSNGSARAWNAAAASNGAGTSDNPIPLPEVAPAPSLDEVAKQTDERIVELLRSSNAHAKSLSRLAKQLEELRDTGAVDEDPVEAEKWKRSTCPSCGRALPENSKVCPFCVNRLRALKRLFAYLIPYSSIAFLNLLLSVCDRALSFVSPVVFAYLVDYVFTPSATSPDSFIGRLVPVSDRPRALAILVGIIIGASLLNSIMSIARGRSVAYLGSRVLHDIRAQLYAHLQRLSLAYYDKREVGAVMSRVQNDVGMIQNFLLNGAEEVILASLTLIGVITVMMTRSVPLTLLVLLPVPFVIVATNAYWRGLMKLWRRVWHQNSSLGARLADTLGGVRVVRAFAAEDREVESFVDKSAGLRDATVGVEQKAATFYPTLGFVMGLGGPLVFYFGGRQIIDGTLTVGGLTLFTVLLTRLYEPIQSLTRLVNFTTRAMTAAERVFEVLDTEPDIREANAAVSMPKIEGRVEFKDVVFGYERHRPVLHGVSMTIEPGEMVGLVGHSGAGKSTLINLLMRFYDVSEGQILVDGVDMRDIKRDDIRRQIGVVLQESYLFHGSVYDNIRYGRPDAQPHEVIAAARAAYAHDFIVSFPDGYDTRVGERGTRLSGGERQRISIARAILHNPKILILDEATASVDTETEQQIQKALQNLTKGRTTIAIAHRLSTLRDAHRLIVLEGGKIAEQGTHDELMAQRGAFHKLVNAQRAMNEVIAIVE
jgi:ATP-binding cassette subfamily B protein